MLHKRSIWYRIGVGHPPPHYMWMVFFFKVRQPYLWSFFFLQRFLIGLTPSPHCLPTLLYCYLIYSINKSKTCKTLNGNPKTYVMITSKTVNGRFTTLYTVTFISGIFPSVIHTHLHWRMNWKLANINETIFPSQLFLIRDLWAVKRIRNPWLWKMKWNSKQPSSNLKYYH